ncbi:hypothetical protein ACIBKY_31110 [Nonomuraea sp. NPDC050394]|uniref:hypothetical protein n=1 Tax=Nonomuraea sp. NPDC050394 TaxID=3364363 RepID=UPI0037A2D92F
MIGSTGGREKIGYLVGELGFDYHDGPVAARPAELAPDGIDVFFDTLDLEPAVLRDVTIRGFTTPSAAIPGGYARAASSSPTP